MHTSTASWGSGRRPVIVTVTMVMAGTTVVAVMVMTMVMVVAVMAMVMMVRVVTVTVAADDGGDCGGRQWQLQELPNAPDARS